jgi:IS30 family transposase
MPPRLDTNKKIRHFLTKFQGFIVENNKLYYQDTEHKLEVLKRADIDNKLRELYNNQDFSVGSGQTSLYFKVRDMYLNIKRNDVAEFLKKQPSYQMSRNTRHHINRPIRASQANERFVIDLIDVGEDYVDNGYRYILTCVDYFTRYVWCEALRTKTAIAVRDAMQTIVHRAGDTYPSIIQSDNGGEFQGELLDWMREHNITHIKTLSYTPQSNGLVENANGQIRKILREFMLRKRNLH